MRICTQTVGDEMTNLFKRGYTACLFGILASIIICSCSKNAESATEPDPAVQVKEERIMTEGGQDAVQNVDPHVKGPADQAGIGSNAESQKAVSLPDTAKLDRAKLKNKMAVYEKKFFPQTLRDTKKFKAKLPFYAKPFMNADKQAKKFAKLLAYIEILKEQQHPLYKSALSIKQELAVYNSSIISGKEKFSIGKAKKMDAKLKGVIQKIEKSL